MTPELIIVNKPEEVFLHELRTKTQPMHTQLEATPLSVALLKSPLQPHSYASYLMAMKEVIDFCETQLFSVLEPVITDLATRRKLPAIAADLTALVNYLPSSHYPAFSPLTLPIDKATALGYLYVIEGSTLGGRVILKQIENTPELKSTQATQFFSGYGANTGRMWKSFLDAFSAYSVQSHQQSQIIGGAIHAFESIRNYFLLVQK